VHDKIRKQEDFCQEVERMRLLRMTTARWMILVAAVSVALALLMFLRRLAANKVAGIMQKVREQAGLPPDTPLADFDVPVTRDMLRWILFDEFLSRFWIVLLALIVLVAWAIIAYFPGGAVKASAPIIEPGQR
jgi:hypothetical protein